MPQPDSDRRRPGQEAASSVTASDPQSLRRMYERDADHALRIAWLRVMGQEMFEVDTSGLLSAQLWDFADLLEVARDRGWFR